MQVESTQLFKVRDVADLFTVSVATVYRLVESGELPALRLGTGRGSVRITGEAINAYMAHVMTGQSRVERWANLSPAQADGLACVMCGAEFLAGGEAQWPVGRSVAGSQVFACASHATVDESASAVAGEAA